MGRDIYAEPEGFDIDTLRNLGPLTPLAGTWEGSGADTHPVASGSEEQPYRERMLFEPIDPQTNGPQLLYGLRYHIHINKLGELLTFHDQIGYWLWEPATGSIFQSLAIPRGQVALATGAAASSARQCTVKATLGSPVAGIVSAPFLHENFRTLEYTITVTVNDDGKLGYEQDTVLRSPGTPSRFTTWTRTRSGRSRGHSPTPQRAPPPRSAHADRTLAGANAAQVDSRLRPKLISRSAQSGPAGVGSGCFSRAQPSLLRRCWSPRPRGREQIRAIGQARRDTPPPGRDPAASSQGACPYRRPPRSGSADRPVLTCSN